MHRFSQIDVFTDRAHLGNPVAVVHDADDLDDDTMQRFARWTNLSETTFLLRPTVASADYRVRIFTPAHELPFAGHPTLGTCHAWLESGGHPAGGDEVVQQCAAGLVRVRHTSNGLAFAAPPLVRSGPVDGATADQVVSMLGITHDDVVAMTWADIGPGWIAVAMRDAAAVLALRPRPGDLDVGVVAPQPPGADTDVEVRAFFPLGGATVEDPVTGSLNAGLAMWMLGTGRLTSPYVAAQGTAMGRRGRVHVEQDDDGTIWIGGGTVKCVSGTALF